MNDRSKLLTEQRLGDSMTLDQMSIPEALALMNAQDALAVASVAAERDNIAKSVQIAADKLRGGGRLFYVGAGTSGRLGVLDSVECPPTFGTDPKLVQGIIAGGPDAMFRAVEGAEDSASAGESAMLQAGVNAGDAVVGIAAGGTTPFVHGALAEARKLGAATIFLCCVQANQDDPTVDVIIRPLTGPEVLTGSTRLKAATATKLVLNAISTLVMVQLGKVYENLMVDLRAGNQKLWDRGARIVSALTGLDRDVAMELLKAADGRVKTAIVMQRRGVARDDAQQLLDQCGGQLRDALRTI